MKILSAQIILAKGRSPYKAEMVVEKGDLIESCVICGGDIYKDADIDLLVKGCFINDCEYSIKDCESVTPPCPVIASCVIKDCKLPHCCYVGCVFESAGVGSTVLK